MKLGRPLTDLASELERQANAKRDYLTPSETLTVHSNGRTELVAIGEPYHVADVAHGQIADYLDIPRGFYESLRGNAETITVPAESGIGFQGQDQPLFDVMVNSLFHSKGEQRRLVRTLDGRVRAFLSDAYNLDLDNFDVFRMAALAIEEAGLGPDNVVSAEVTERKLYIKVVSPRMEAVVTPEVGMLKEPQVVQAGFVLSNSETGLGSLRVSQMIYKLVCMNGWIREESYRQRHIGKTLEAEENGNVYRSDTRLADARARLLKVRDHVSAALDEGAFHDLVARIQWSASVRLESPADKVVEAASKKFALSQSEKDNVLSELIAGADLSLWGLSNAITAAAQTVASYDRATELEAIGGRMFSLSAPEVREIVQAN